MTYIMTIQTDDAIRFEKIRKLAQELGVVTVERDEPPVSDMSAAAQEFIKLQQKYPPRKISGNIDINSIIDELNT